MAIQRTVGCSDRKMLVINRCLSVILGKKKLQPGLASALTSRNKTLKDLFTVSEVSFITKVKNGKKEVEKEVVKTVV